MNKRDVFISHSHKDKKIADAVCHHFEQEGMRCWIAPRDITPGAKWAESIAHAIPDCRIMLIIFSSDANMSKQVQREVELAIKYKLMIVPLRIEDINPTGSMEYYLSTVHWIDAVNVNSRKYLKELAETVKGYIGDAKSQAGDKRKTKTAGVIHKPKKNRLALFITLGAAALAVVAVVFVFKDSIFTAGGTLLESPTPSNTHTPAPTELVDKTLPLNTIVYIEDNSLRTCILKTLDAQGIENDGQLTIGKMQQLTELNILKMGHEREGYYQSGHNNVYANGSVTTLEGLQYASNLQSLTILGQNVKDISALSQIENIRYLDLTDNSIEYISSLSSHKNLEDVYLTGNKIEDISPLYGMSSIKFLDIGRNEISDVTTLVTLTQLEELHIMSCEITSITPLSSLQNLQRLKIINTDIDDLESLLNFPALDWLLTDSADYRNNEQLYQALREKGCTVKHY